jgi:hypothetical protein
MYRERALDWEQNFISSAIIHPFFTNYAKFHERNDLQYKAAVFKIWRRDPAKRFVTGMLRFRGCL